MKKPPIRPRRPLLSLRPERGMREPDEQSFRRAARACPESTESIVRRARAAIDAQPPIDQCVRQALSAIEEISEPLSHAQRIEAYEQVRSELSIFIEAERDDMRNEESGQGSKPPAVTEP
jgi:hypothetical protein